MKAKIQQDTFDGGIQLILIPETETELYAVQCLFKLKSEEYTIGINCQEIQSFEVPK